MERKVIDWMLDADPSLRWQVERDIVGVPEDVWRATRARVATEGFGRRLLDLQDPDGQWAGGAYFPGDYDWHEPHPDDGGGQPWIATTWTLNALRTFGLDPAALTDTATRLDANSRWEYDDLPYWGGEVDCCINAFTLANGAWLGVDTSPLLDWFDDHRMDDGGWDCEWENGSTRSSFHSTLNTLMGLADYQRITGESTKELRRAAEEYLLSRDLYKRRSTGEPVADWVFVLAYPFRWRYSILHAGVYFRAAGQLDGAAPDPRMAEAMEWVRDQRQPDGTWIQGHRFPGRVWFDIDVPPGEPSKWLTYSAMGVLAWWDGDSAA